MSAAFSSEAEPEPVDSSLGVFSFHLVETRASTVVRALTKPPAQVGLRHVECMMSMKLGEPIYDPRRYQAKRLAMFARWDDEASIDRFLSGPGLGAECASGWHVRMAFVRRWGAISELEGLPIRAEKRDPDLPVIAVTLARLKLAESLRFLTWGKPVERLVRDHPGQTMALAASRPHHTLSTFSMWNSATEMESMVRGGRPDVTAASSHIDAMGERDRKDFHHEFTTLRFREL